MNIGSLGGEVPYAFASGINDSGQIVGKSESSSYFECFRIYEWRACVTLAHSPVEGLTPSRLTTQGDVVDDSSAGVEGDYTHAFVYSSGQMQDLRARSEAVTSIANDINESRINRRESSYVDGRCARPCVPAPRCGAMQDLGTLGGFYSAAYGINASGEIVGFASLNDDEEHAFLYANGSMEDLGTLGGDSSWAYGINSAGEVVGWAYTADSAQHAFVYANGSMQDLNLHLDSSGAGVLVEVADCVNDNGLIAGFGTSPTSGAYPHALLLTPVAANAVLPSAYSAIVGTVSSGSLYSIQFNDSWYVTVLPGVTTLLSEAPVQVQFSGTSPTMSPANFQFTFSGHVNSINLSQRILLYNFITNSYETLNTSAAHVGSDSTVTVTPSGNLTRFVNQSTGEVRARVNFSRTGRTSVLLWTASLGVANWIIQ